MANADFNPKQTGTPGGFDAGSYREKASPEQAVQLTPLQQKLAGLEAKLPAALTRQAVALALSIVVMLAAFLGFGSAKLRSRYNEVRKWYTVGVAADNEPALTRYSSSCCIPHLIIYHNFLQTYVPAPGDPPCPVKQSPALRQSPF